MKVFKKKKIIDSQQYDDYWKLTVEYTDIYDMRFNNTLKIIVLFIDQNHLDTVDICSNEFSEMYKKLQNEIDSYNPKSNKASVRKSINQFIKLGFVKPFLKGYHKLCKRFLNVTDHYEKSSLFTKIFYENASLSSSVKTDKTNIKEINFLLKTLAYKPDQILTKNDIIALMVTPNISRISKGYLTKDELDRQYAYSKKIKFENKKYNQITYLFKFLNYVPNIHASKDSGVSFINPNEVKIDTKRDPILYGLLKKDLKAESTRIYGDTVCYLKKVHQKGLICSHIKDSAVCLNEGKIDEAYDYYNTLFLAPDVDSYFDTYSISFDDNGKMLINSFERHDFDYVKSLSKYSLDKIILTPERLKYLQWHRSKFEEKLLRDKKFFGNKILGSN